MITRLRKATTAWTARLRQSYARSIREQPAAAEKEDTLSGSRREGTGGTPDIPDFELLRCIGRGSYGEVWLARNILGTYRAVKIVERKAFQNEEAFEREFSGLQQFEPVSREHDGFVAILHVSRNRSAGFFYYVMELADNDTKGDRIEPDTYIPKTLSNELARCGRFSVRKSVELGLSLSQALAELHQRGLVHRDVKPSNIIFVKGHAKLADIGLVAQTGEKNRLGTEGYIPPEGPGKPQADLYSVGMVLYEASTGTDRLDYPNLPADFHAMAEREAFLKLNAIILKACDNDVRKRYRTATEISDDLAKLGFGAPVREAGRNFRRPLSIFSAVLGALALALAFYWLRGPRTAPVPEKSIAVLPFENLSADPEDAYFAEGIQEEILTRLAKITDLRVISRTSTRRYQSRPDNLSQIAKQLGVANIVEGSVQKAGNEVRVNAQLINARTDSHLWAESYDRELTNVFGVESEIAKGIAESLQAKLTNREEQALAAKPTDNPEAYDAYLRGLAFQARIGQSIHLALTTIGYFERAVQLDPNFAIAWARLSRTHAYLYLQRVDAARPDLAKDALEHAQKLQPNSPETLLALGYYQYWILRDYGLAKATFHQVNKLSPGSSEVARALSSINRRLGKWNESLAAVEAGLALDPRNGELLTTSAWTYSMLRQFPTALKRYEQALDIIANDPDLMSLEAGVYQALGNLEQAAKFLSEVNEQTPFDNAFFVKVTQLRLERNHTEVIRLLQARLAQFQFTSKIYKGTAQVYLAIAQHLAGDAAGAVVSAEQARNTLEPLCKSQPDNSNFAEWLALAYALLGEKQLALKEAELATMLLPSAKDAVDGPGTEENLALVQAISGENSSAIATLRRLLQTPFQSQLYAPMPLAPAFLRLDPLWDFLRNDPRFEKLTEDADQQVATELLANSAPPSKSIAVLPFEDLSNKREDASFADGVQDDILTKLAKVTDLKVISRTSVMQYRGKQNTREIGKALGVSYVLEGSVRKTGARLHINAQLIDTRTDTHTWAEQYDFGLNDMFAVQSEIAKKIGGRLHAKLSPTEEAAIEQPPTTRLPAFDLYTRAKNLLLRMGLSSNERANLLEAASLLNQAVAKDPSFFDAYCLLSYIHDLLYFLGLDHTAARLALAEIAIQSASRLRPDAGDTHLARAQNLYYGYLDYDGALTELELARQTLPNDPRVFELTGYIQRRQGRWEESTQNLERAIELDPRNTDILEQATLNYVVLRRYTEEKSVWDRMIDIMPNNPETQTSRAQAELNSRADTRPLHQVVDSIRATNPGAIPAIAHAWLVCALAERDATAAREALLAATDNPINLGGEVYFNGLFMEGVIARMTKDDNKARSAFTAARAEQEKIIQAQPNFGPAVCVLGLIDAALGRKEEALREGRRAVELVPIEKDSMRSRSIIRYFAIIAAWVGDKDLACEQLSIAARPPSTLSYGQLMLLPLWDPLRGDPRFEKVVASLAPK